MKHVIKIVTRIINFIHGKSLANHPFKEFPEDIDTKFDNVVFCIHVCYSTAENFMKECLILAKKLIFSFQLIILLYQNL